MISMILAIVLTRIIVFFHDFDFMIGSFELHHFHEGVALVIIGAVILTVHKKATMPLIAILGFGAGLIIDEIEYIARNLQTLPEYNATIISSAVLALFMVIAITSFQIKHASKNETN